MAADKKLATFFDISMQEHMEAVFQTTTSDKVFIFSGPPAYTSVKDDGRILCPLLFTSGFVIGERRFGGQKVGGLGTNTTIDLPSTQGANSVSINGFAVITSKPSNTLSGQNPQSTTEDSKDNWNLLKRLYMDAISFQDGKLLKYFLPDTNSTSLKSNVGFNVVGSSPKDIFSNFGMSEFYEIPFGLYVIMLTKGHRLISHRYLEGCKVLDPGAMLSTQTGGPANMQNAIQISFRNELPIADDALFDTSGSDTSGFMSTLKDYIGTYAG